MAYEALGSEFLVNTSTSGSQLLPDVTALVGGGYIICWTDPSGLGGDNSGYAIKAQLYASDGTPVGGEFLVNTNTLADQKVAQVAALENGGFAITWYDYSNQGADNSGSGVVVRLYAADGSPVSGEIAVNTITTGDQVEPYVAGLAGGGFVVTWIDYNGDGSGTAVRAQAFASDGTQMGAEILVNTETNSYQIQPQISGLENGNFVITWADLSGIGGDASGACVKAQLFSADGTRIGGEFLVNTQTANEQSDPTVTGLVGGGFVITWNDHSGVGPDSSGWGIKAQMYAENGAPIGGEFLVNTVTFDEQQGPSIAALPDGGFIITWMDYAGTFGGAGGGIKAQIFAPDGTPNGTEFLVNSIDDDRQLYPDVAAQQDGSFLITWSSNGLGGDGSDYGVKAQLFLSDSVPSGNDAIARNDAFTTSELSAISGNLFADNGSGADSDSDGPALSISAVDGNAAAVGSTITLGSGALLTVNADGTFSYDPDGAFEPTPTAGSGASNTPSSDSFTYTLAGGDTATVNVTVTGVDNNDVLLGTAGNDVLTAGVGNDAVYGGAGDDLIRGRAGDDLIDGGDGFDRAGYYHTDEAAGGVTVNLNIVGPQNTGSQGWDTLNSIEYVSGTPFSDILTGDENDNILWGSTATIDPDSNWVSTTNNDTLYGGGGNDLLAVGIGNHSLTGGSGVDTLLFTENFGDDPAIHISLALQGVAQDTGQGLWTLNGIENLSGGNDDDQLTGDDNANILAGSFGNDTLNGGGANDSLYGDGSIDSGAPASGPPTLFPDVGANGNDILDGGDGDDQLYGGGGIDTASFASANGAVTAFLYNGGFGEADGAAGYDQLHDIENLEGSAFNDILYGNSLANVVSGGDGHDDVRGRGGNDVVIGGNGDDFLSGGLGDDVIDGGAGIDRAAFYTDASSGVTVDLNLQGTAQNTGQGMDTLIGIENVSGTFYSDTLIGDGGDNMLWGSPATLTDGTVVSTNNDTLIGGGGNDLLIVGIGNHSVDGGSGTDTLRFTENGFPESGITLSLVLQGAAQSSGNGDWTLTGIENLSGSVAGDILTGDNYDNVLAGDLGDDLLVGGAGNDILYGDGQINWDGHGTGRSGPITTYADATGLYVGGVSGNDTLEGGAGDDQLYGGGGNDTASFASESGAVQAFLYNGGNGEAFADDGYDQLHDIENLTGSAFNDVLVGNNIANALVGGDGHDVLRGNGGDDSLYGGVGDDLLYGNAGNDYMDGGNGFDRVGFFSGATAGVHVDLNIQGVAQDTGQGMDTLVNIEHATGTAFSDTLIGNADHNWLGGQSDALGMVDTISGNGGDDLISDGFGDHILDGGSGIDFFAFTTQQPTAGVTISLALQGSAQNTGAGMMTLTNFEGLSGSVANDTLTGDGGGNYLLGDQGDDTLVGGAGNDTLFGDGTIGPDTHGIGGSGPVFLNGDVASAGGVDGNDLLEGGTGIDRIDGGGGVDTATYAHASGSVTVTLNNNMTGNGAASGADGVDSLFSIENIIGSAYNDTITGSAVGNVIYGGDGNDFLQARGGDDTVYGGNGDDYLGGGTGNDYLDGGAGYDRASFSNGSTGPVHVDLRLQGSAQDTGLGMDTLIGIESLTGTAFGDSLTGDGGDNWLWGGNDAPGSGDTIDGQGGNDLIEDGVGDHVLSGGAGTDTFLFNPFTAPTTATISLALQGAAQDTGAGVMTLTGFENLSGGSYSDTLIGDANNNLLAGSEAGDTLIGGAGNDILYGDGFVGTSGSPSGQITTYTDIALLGGIDGNDLLEGGLGNDTLDGGGGTDIASYAHASGAVTVVLAFGTASGADGNDTLTNVENVIGSAFADTLAGNGGANVLSGGDGLDTLAGFGGDDALSGGAGSDNLYGHQGNDTLDGGDGNDNMRGGSGNDVIDGGTGFNLAGYFGTPQDPVASGVTVDLNLQGSAQNTGQGSDTLLNIQGLAGTQFADTLIGDNNANLLIQAGAGVGAPGGNDQLFGNGGDDLLIVGSGNVLLNGGLGNDTVSFNAAGETLLNGVTVSLAAQGSAQATGSGAMTLTGIENLSGTGLADALTGDGGNNDLNGAGGDDVLVGGAGDDNLRGDAIFAAFSPTDGTILAPYLAPDATVFAGQVAGNDTLEGGLGNDTLDGGSGTDTATYAHASGGVNVNLGAGSASGADGNDTLANIEKVIGSEFADTLNGSSDDNVLEGLGGNDVIQGQGGNDTLYGGDGDDTVRGDAGENSLTVSGDDVIYGGNGNDGLRGGLGNDQLFGGANNDLLRGNGGVDYFDGGSDDGTGINGIGDRVSFFEARATQGAVADLRTGIISNDGFGNVETMVGIESLGADTAFVDTFYGNDARNFIGGSKGDNLYGFGGDDQFQTGAAAAVVDGGTGIDLLQLDSSGGWLTPDIDADGLAESAAAALSGWTVNLTAGTMLDGYGNSGTISGIENINGSQFGDTLIGDANANVLNGFDGDDTLNGRGGNDTLDGGNGSDTASYANASGIVTVNLSAGTVTGADGNDTLISIENVIGSAFADTITGDANANVLNGGGGNDNFDARLGNDTLIGGAGIDTASYANASGAVTVSLTLGTASGADGSDTLATIENVTGSVFADAITGDVNANILNGGDGDDTLNGRLGNDTLNGGNGIDTASYANASAAVTINLNTGNASGADGTDTLIAIENVIGSAFADTITGDLNANVINGGDGNDTILAGRGDDIVYGGRGNDVMTGSQGNDRYVIEASSGSDTVVDFVIGNDKIVFDPSSSVTAFSQLTITKVGADARVSWTGGNSILLQGVRASSLTASDFQFGSAAFATAQFTSTSTDGALIGVIAGTGLAQMTASAPAYSATHVDGFAVSGVALHDQALAPQALDSLFSPIGGVSMAAPDHYQDVARIGPTEVGTSSLGLGGGSLDARLGGSPPTHPTDLLQATAPAAHGPVVVTLVTAAPSVALPSAEQLATVGYTAEPMQTNAVVGRVLADALGGGHGHSPSVDALIESLPNHHGGSSGEALASIAGANGAAGSYWAFNPAVEMFGLDQMMVHQDAAPMHG